MPSTSTAFSDLQENLKQGLTGFRELWSVEAKDWITSVYATDINQDGDIEVLAGSRDGRVYALARDGQQIWDSVVGGKVGVSSIIGMPGHPNQQQPAYVIAGTRDGKIYVLDEDGNEVNTPQPRHHTPSSTPPATNYWCDIQQSIVQLQTNALSPGTIAFGSENGCAYSFDMASGEMLWTFPTDGQVQAIAVCDLDRDGYLETLVGSEDHTLYVLSHSGKLLAQHQMDQSIFSLLAVDIDHDGEIEILVGTRTKKLYALTPDLREKWSLLLSSRPLALSIADVNDDQRDEIVVACDDQSLHILDDTGRLIWYHKLNKRFYSLYTLDLDRDRHTEILAGSDDSRVYALRIQLTKDLDKEIRRNYAALAETDRSTLLGLTSEQRELLLNTLGTSDRILDNNLTLEQAEDLLVAGNATDALLSLLKLDQQKFQPLWEKKAIGYLSTLCLASISNNSLPVIVASSPDGGISTFTPSGELLWSETQAEGKMVDVQSGYLSRESIEDLAFVTSTGQLWLMHMNKEREIVPFAFPEPVSCFHVLASNHQGPAELLIGSESGKVWLYTNDFHTPAQLFHLRESVQIVYATEPYEGLYRTPEILISTAPNQLFAYTRGGNRLWTFNAHDRILAICAKDLDGNGHLEVLVGSEDCNIYVLDHRGNLRWRYFLYHSVLALETADLDGDGNLEILVGCADGLIYVFKSTGDLIWRYQSKDSIQALRVFDTGQDDNRGIAVISEGRLEILQILNQVKLTELIKDCWSQLLAHSSPLDSLLPLIEGSNPFLRAAALNRLTQIAPPLPAETFNLLEKATHDTTADVRKTLPEAIMRAYPADPVRARVLLDALFVDRFRDVRIEIIEHLELLAAYDWNLTLVYMNRAIQSPDRNTRRAAIRKISHLIRGTAGSTDASYKAPAEALFRLLLDAAQGTDREWGKSEWIKQEAARVLADLLNRFSEDFLVYLYQLLKHQLFHLTLRTIAYNLTSPDIQQAFTSLLTLSFDLTDTNASNLLATTTKTLEAVHNERHGADLWLIFHELQEMFNISTLEELATYEFHLKQEQFQDINYTINSFLLIGGRLGTITRHLKPYLRSDNPGDRLNSLQDGLNALEVLQRLANNEYHASPIAGSPQPYEPEFVALKTLLARWQEMFNVQINELRGRAELVFELPLRQLYFEDKVGISLEIANHGLDIAHNVKVTILNNEHCAILHPSAKMKAIYPQQQATAEFLIKPFTTEPLTLTIEILYDDSRLNAHTFTTQEHLNFIKWPHEFTRNKSPYATGTPIQNSRMFYGREVALNYLQDNLTRDTAQTVLVLYGQRRSGKTTLLYQLANSSYLSGHLPVMLDLQSLAMNFTVGNFFFRVAYEIYRAMNKKGLTISKPVQSDFIKPSDPNFSFDCFLDEVEVFLDGQKLIILLDEFEMLEEQVNQSNLDPGIFPYLRSLMQKRQYMHFLLSGTHRIEQLTSDYWSIFFNIALHYRLPGRITAAGAKALITEPMLGSLEYDVLAVAKIRQLTADQPYLIHLICGSLVAYCNQQRKNYATLNDVNLVLDEVIRTGAIHFDWLWKQLETPKRLLLQIIAEGTKEGKRKISSKEISVIYREYGYSYHYEEVDASLKTLRNEDVIEINEGEQQKTPSDSSLYYVPIGLLRHWLRHEKPLRTKAEEEADQHAEEQSNEALRQTPVDTLWRS